jgi:pyridoxal phosphate enzyme (YggS family)
MRSIEEPALDSRIVRERCERLLARLRRVAEGSGHDPDALRVVAVTKGFDVTVARLAVEAGLQRLGENRVQEALPKVAALPDAEWHLVGHLQSNKVRPAVGAFSWIHSVDSLPLLRRIDAIAHDDDRRPALLLQVNLTAESSKSGFDAEWFAAAARPGRELVSELRGLRFARVVGLMTIAALGASDEAARATFRRLRELRDDLQDAAGSPLPELSMGMTADAEAAVAEGATLVRIGTGLFGPRPR